MVDYEKTAKGLIENAADYTPSKYLDQKQMFASIRELCESPAGGLALLDATSNINWTTKNKLITILKFACDKANSDANAINATVEILKPLMLFSVGFIVALMVGIFLDPPDFDSLDFDSFESKMGLTFSIASVASLGALWYKIRKRDKQLEISIKSSSLIEIANM